MRRNARRAPRFWCATSERSWNVALRAKVENELEIVVYDVIGKSFWGEGISSKDFIAKLGGSPKARKITLRVNSVGGLTDDAKAMVNLLSERAADGVEIVGIVDGLAASSASYLLTAATRVEMPANAFQMLHGVRGAVRGTAEEVESYAELIRRTNAQFAAAYAAASARRGKKKTADEFLAMFASGDTYLDADQAIEWGLADAKTESLKLAACLADLHGIENAPELVKSAPYVSLAARAEPEPPRQLPLPSIPPTSGQKPGEPGKEIATMDLKVLAKLLGLAETATAEEVSAELNKRLTAQAAPASVTVSGVQLLGVATEAEATAKIQEFQRGILQFLGATQKATVAEALGIMLDWKTKADQADGLTKQLASATEESRVAKRDAAIEKMSREGTLPPARHEWARAQFQTAEAVLSFCEGMPKGFFNSITTPNNPEASTQLTATEKEVCKQLGMSEEAFLAEKKIQNSARPTAQAGA